MGLLDKMSGLFFKDEEEYAEEEEIREEQRKPIAMPDERPVWKEQESKKGKRTNLMTIPTKDSLMEMVLVKATSYDDMQIIAGHIKDRKVVVVNFEEMDKDIAQRMVDFLSGAVFALDGLPRKVSGGTFIFSSSSVDLSGQIMESDASAFTNSGMFSRFESDDRPWSRK